MVQAAAADSRHEHTELFQRAASQSEWRDRNVHRVERPCEQMTSSYQPDLLLHNSRLVNGYGLFALRLFILGHSQVFHYNQVLTCPGPCFKTACFWDQCPSHTHRLRQSAGFYFERSAAANQLAPAWPNFLLPV